MPYGHEEPDRAIITIIGVAASEASPSMIRAKMPLSPRRFHRLQGVSGGSYSFGASHYRKPL